MEEGALRMGRLLSRKTGESAIIEQERRQELNQTMLLSQIAHLEDVANTAQRQAHEMENYIYQLEIAVCHRDGQGTSDNQRGSSNASPRERVRHIIDGVNGEYARLNNLVDRFNQATIQLQEENARLRTENDGLRAENENLLKEKVYALDKANQFQNQIADLSGQVYELTQKGQDQTNVSELEVKISSLEQGMKTTQQTFSRKEREYQQRIRDLQTELDAKSKPETGNSVSPQHSSTTEKVVTTTSSPEVPPRAHTEPLVSNVPSVGSVDDTRTTAKKEESESTPSSSLPPPARSTPSTSGTVNESTGDRPNPKRPVPNAPSSRRPNGASLGERSIAQLLAQNRTSVSKASGGPRVSSNSSVTKPNPTPSSVHSESTDVPSIAPTQRKQTDLRVPEPAPGSARWINEKAVGKYPDIHVEAVKRASVLKDRMWYIIYALGAYGVATRDDVTRVVQDIFGVALKAPDFSAFIPTLCSLDLIAKDSVPGARSSPFEVIELTKKGMRWFCYLFDGIALLKPSEIVILRKEHDNLQHGYFIKDAVSVLLEAGYIDVSMDRVQNTYQLGDRAWIPDIVATSPAGTKIHIEVELMNHTQAQFDDKFNKASYVTKDLYFFVWDKEKSQELSDVYSRWYFKEKQAGHDADRLTVYVNTLRNVQARKGFLGNPVHPMPPQSPERVTKKEE